MWWNFRRLRCRAEQTVRAKSTVSAAHAQRATGDWQSGVWWRRSDSAVEAAYLMPKSTSESFFNSRKIFDEFGILLWLCCCVSWIGNESWEGASNWINCKEIRLLRHFILVRQTEVKGTWSAVRLIRTWLVTGGFISTEILHVHEWQTLPWILKIARVLLAKESYVQCQYHYQ